MGQTVRTLIVSASRGVFLDTCFGGLVFSRQVSVLYCEAETFADVIDAKRFIARVHDTENTAWQFPADLSFVAVKTAWQYATMAECVAAGQPAWVVTEARPFAVNLGNVTGHTMTVGPVSSGKSTSALAVMAALKGQRPM